MSDISQEQKKISSYTLTLNGDFQSHNTPRILQTHKSLHSNQALRKFSGTEDYKNVKSPALTHSQDRMIKMHKHLQIQQFDIKDFTKLVNDHERTSQQHRMSPMILQVSQKNKWEVSGALSYKPLEFDFPRSQRKYLNIEQQPPISERNKSKSTDNRESADWKSLSQRVETENIFKKERMSFMIDKGISGFNQSKQTQQNVKALTSSDFDPKDPVDSILEISKIGFNFDGFKKSKQLCALSRRKFSNSKKQCSELFQNDEKELSISAGTPQPNFQTPRKMLTQHQLKLYIHNKQKHHLNENQRVKEHQFFEEGKTSQQTQSDFPFLEDQLECSEGEKEKVPFEQQIQLMPSASSINHSNNILSQSSIMKISSNQKSETLQIFHYQKDLNNDPSQSKNQKQMEQQQQQSQDLKFQKQQCHEAQFQQNYPEGQQIFQQTIDLKQKKKVVVLSRLRLKNNTSEKQFCDDQLNTSNSQSQRILLNHQIENIEENGEQQLFALNTYSDFRKTTKINPPPQNNIFFKCDSQFQSQDNVSNANSLKFNTPQSKLRRFGSVDENLLANTSPAWKTNTFLKEKVSEMKKMQLSPMKKGEPKIYRQLIEFQGPSRITWDGTETSSSQKAKDQYKRELSKDDNNKNNYNRSSSPQKIKPKDACISRNSYLNKLREGSPVGQKINEFNKSKKTWSSNENNGNHNLLSDFNSWNKYQIVQSVQSSSNRK